MERLEMVSGGDRLSMDVDPDKLIEPGSRCEAFADSKAFPGLEKFDFMSTLEERMKRVPADNDECKYGQWEGERGNAKFVPTNEVLKKALAAFGIDGIYYRDGIPDFSPVSAATVKIDMTAERFSYVESADDGSISRVEGNYEKADKACANQWNETSYMGRSDWTSEDVAKYREACKLTWHECSDRTTCMLVPRNIHELFRHTGGCFECSKVRA